MNRLSHLGRGLVAALILFCTVPVMAAVIHFDDIAPDIYSSGDVLQSASYQFLFLADPTSAANGWSSGVGALLDGSVDSSCDILACPSGASGNYLAILNDGGVTLSHARGFTLAGFDYSFIAPVAGGIDQNWGQLQLSGLLRDGSMMTVSLDFPTQGSDGNYHFQPALLPAAFGRQVFLDLSFNACIFNAAGICSNTLAFPAFNQAQFGLDNISINAVVEPSTSMLMLAGLAAIGMLSRRRQAHRLQGV